MNVSALRILAIHTDPYEFIFLTMYFKSLPSVAHSLLLEVLRLTERDKERGGITVNYCCKAQHSLKTQITSNIVILYLFQQYRVVPCNQSDQ